MLNKARPLVSEEDGAVTVDWVVLTAAVVSLAMAVIYSYGSGAQGISETVSTTLAARPTTVTW